MEIPVLNLLNFEQPFSAGCRYVLTSPRSLRACREAGVKPIELLFKSPDDFIEQVLFQEYEKERQRKLEFCRALRTCLISNKKIAAKENVSDVANKTSSQNEWEQMSLKTSLPLIEEVKAVTPRTIIPMVDELNVSPLNFGPLESNFELLKPNISSMRSIRICDKRANTPCKNKTKESRKMPKIGQGVQNQNVFRAVNNNFLNPDYRVYKFKKIIENSVERELKQQRVELTQKELEQGLERWQDRVLISQWAAMTRAQEQVDRELEARMEKLQERNKLRNILHKHNLNKVKEEEDYKVESLRKQVQYKDLKITSLHKERERVICESRNRAHSVADLKQQIRDIMTPETFDQKLIKHNRARRVYNIPVACPSFIQRSHIRLG